MKAHATYLKQDTPGLSQEKLPNFDEEAIEECNISNNPVVEDVEEAVMVAFDRSGESGEMIIVTDPEEIKNIELEEQERKRNVSFYMINIFSEY